MTKAAHLSRRERQIMDIVYELNEASAKEVLDRLPNPPGYSAVRAMLNKLEVKGHLRHRESELRYIYFPTVDHNAARQSAISGLLKTFFEGSVSQAVSALISTSQQEISERELDELKKLVEQAKKNRSSSKKKS
ncbi:MAG: BlaI/MecI/CopY family transcriptional regulator [Pseudohongiellaceae bacterium]